MTASVNNTSARKGGRNACRTVTASCPLTTCWFVTMSPSRTTHPVPVPSGVSMYTTDPTTCWYNADASGPTSGIEGQRCGGRQRRWEGDRSRRSAAAWGRSPASPLASGVGSAMGVAVGSGVGKTMAVGVGSGMGSAMGVGVGSGVGKVMGVAVGSAIGERATRRPPSRSLPSSFASISSAEGPHPATTTSAASMMRTLAGPANITPATPARAAPAQVARVVRKTPRPAPPPCSGRAARSHAHPHRRCPGLRLAACPSANAFSVSSSSGRSRLTPSRRIA